MSKTRQTKSTVRAFGLSFAAPQSVDFPESGWDQLLYLTSGVATILTGDAVWVLPTHRALWIPDRAEHTIRTTGPVTLCSLYFRARTVSQLPRRFSLIHVSPLLHELILVCMTHRTLTTRQIKHRRLAAVLRDQLEALPALPLLLPKPRERRALRFAQTLEAAPHLSVAVVAAAIGVGLRTLERIFRLGTGIPISAWRRRLLLLQALQRLSAGASVAAVATACGYKTPSAFVAMFRRELGITPGRYFDGQNKAAAPERSGRLQKQPKD